MTNDKEAVEDLAQEVFHNAFKSIKSFQGKSTFFTWLYRIAINTSINFVKTNAKISCAEDVSTSNGYSKIESLKSDGTPETFLENKQLGQMLLDAILSLPEDKRTMIILRDIEGLSYEEIAEILNCPIGTVRSKLSRARTKVISKLKGHI